MNIADVLYEKVALKVNALVALNSKERYLVEMCNKNTYMMLTYKEINVEGKELPENYYFGGIKDKVIDLMYEVLISIAYFNIQDQKGWKWNLCSLSVKKSLVIDEARKIYHQQKRTLRDNCFITTLINDYDIDPLDR